jgi:hypothetical protein
LKYADYIQKEVSYLADVSKSKGSLIGGQNVQMALAYGLEPMQKVATQHKQTKIAKDLENRYNQLYGRFQEFFGSGQ